MPLASYAVRAETSRGRLHREPGAEGRSPWQRDRDRIIHSSAFRKLQYKTQVFVNHEGDYYRTRLTHSIEVAQIARSIARELQLDEDLTEALALAHDLGHTPFGHAGEDALNAGMKPFGGFDHNAQSLRIVTKLENRYAAFDGLNLTWETLEGLAKHNGPLRNPPGYIAEYDERHPLDLGSFPSAEAQVAALADDIAYHSHDLDDGMRAGLFGFDDIAASAGGGRGAGQGAAGEPGRAAAAAAARDDPPGDQRVRHRPDRGEPAPARRARPGQFRRDPPGQEAGDRRSPRRWPRRTGAIKEFLHARMYRHWRVNRMTAKSRRVTEELFRLLHGDTSLLPDGWRAQAGERGGGAGGDWWSRTTSRG